MMNTNNKEQTETKDIVNKMIELLQYLSFEQRTAALAMFVDRRGYWLDYPEITHELEYALGK
jgi:hypothetical protein